MHHDLIAAVNRKAIFGAVVLEQAAADINPFLKFVFRLTGLTAFSNPHFIIFQGREAAVIVFRIAEVDHQRAGDLTVQPIGILAATTSDDRPFLFAIEAQALAVRCRKFTVMRRSIR